MNNFYTVKHAYAYVQKDVGRSRRYSLVKGKIKEIIELDKTKIKFQREATWTKSTWSYTLVRRQK